MHSVTHVLFSIMLAEIFGLPLIWVVIGGIMPDSDYLFSSFIEHRTVFHSLLFIGVISLILFFVKDKKASFAFFIGAFSHVMIDNITMMGTTFFWPYPVFFSLYFMDSDMLNIFMLLLSVVLIINAKYLQKKLLKIEHSLIQKVTFGLVLSLIILVLFLGNKVNMYCSSEFSLISSILSNKEYYEGRQVTLNGTVCSEIQEKYYANSGSNYQIFDLCQASNKIKIWKLKETNQNNFKLNDSLVLCGIFTDKYNEPELNFIRQVLIQ